MMVRKATRKQIRKTKKRGRSEDVEARGVQVEQIHFAFPSYSPVSSTSRPEIVVPNLWSLIMLATFGCSRKLRTFMGSLI